MPKPATDVYSTYLYLRKYVKEISTSFPVERLKKPFHSSISLNIGLVV